MIDQKMQHTRMNPHVILLPMVRIPIREYDALRDSKQKRLANTLQIQFDSIIDKIEELTRALRKHIVRKY